MFDNQDKDKKNKNTKQSLSSAAGTERRQRQLNQIRTKTHNEMLKQLREKDDDEALVPSNEGPDPESIWDIKSTTQPSRIPFSLLPMCVEMLQKQSTRDDVLQAVMVIRKLLCVNQNPPNDIIIESGLVPILVQMLTTDDAEIQFEASWAITNLAAGETRHARTVVDANCIPPLVQLLGSANDKCRDQAAWALGNLSGDCADFRDAIIMCGGIPALMHAIEISPANQEGLAVMRDATWAVSNICRRKPLPSLEHVGPIIGMLGHLLYHEDKSVMADAAWSLSYISDGPTERVDAVISAGVLPRIVELLSAPAPEVKMPAIRTIGNCAAGTEAQTQAVINLGALAPMISLLSEPKRAIRKETCWALSNICAGTVEQAEAAVQSNIYVPIVQQAMNAPELDVRREACYCVSNLLVLQIPSHYEYLLNLNVIPPLCNALRVGDPKLLTIALEAIEALLAYGAAVTETLKVENVVQKQIEDCGGVDAIETLQNHHSQDIYEMAVNILETYFESEEGEVPTMPNAMDFLDFNNANNMNNNGGEFNF